MRAHSESMMDFTPNESEQALVVEVSDCNDLDPGVYGHLYGVGPDVPSSSDDHCRLPAHRLRILEEHLPGGHSNDGSRRCFNDNSAIAVSGDHPCRGTANSACAPQNCGLVTP